MAMNATSGVAAFTNLTLSNVGAGYTLQASSSGLTSVTTNPVAAKGIITINGTSNSNNIALTFTDASDFILAINTATPLSYPTGLALGLIYNGPSGAFSKLIFDDPFNVYSATQSFAATDLLRSAFLCDANNVGNLYIYAPTNGKSTATIAVADTAGSNNFFADATNSDYSYIADPGTSTYSELSGFGSESIAGSGGATYAYIYSTSGGKGVEQPDQTTFTSIGVTSTLSSFPQVYLVGASDGSDSATLDAAGGTFVATPGFSYVDATANGVSYLLGALYCAKVTAQASTGGGDKAIFYSYPNNQFNGTTSVTSALAGSTTNGAGAAYNFSAQAAGFATVAVFESGAGTDAAMLTSPGDGVFVEMPTVSILTVGASTITVNTYLIGNLAVPVAGAIVVTGNHDGTDSATIYDAPGNNALTASGSSATLTTSLGSVSINKFSSVTANKQNGTNDTVHIAAAIDFVLSDPGWTSD
jgi:hypothetical protein